MGKGGLVQWGQSPLTGPQREHGDVPADAAVPAPIVEGLPSMNRLSLPLWTEKHAAPPLPMTRAEMDGPRLG